MKSVLCINCGINVYQMKRHLVLQLDTRVVSLLSEWLTPRIISETDYICEACHHVANQNLSENIGSARKAVGHAKVCILCGKSILQKQSDEVLRANPTPIQQTIVNLVSRLIQPCELSSSSHLCHYCWLKMRNQASRQIQTQYTLGEIKQEDRVVNDDISDLNISADSSSIDTYECQSTNIILPNYKRTANTARRCVFPECAGNTLHRISDSFRCQILCDYKLYLPSVVRVCDDHLQGNLWKSLYDSENCYSDFTPEYVEHVFSFIT